MSYSSGSHFLDLDIYIDTYMDAYLGEQTENLFSADWQPLVCGLRRSLERVQVHKRPRNCIKCRRLHCSKILLTGAAHVPRVPLRLLGAIKTLIQGDIVIKVKGPSFRNMLRGLISKSLPVRGLRLCAY